MQSENFDKQIKDSLSQRPPGNDTPAWDKMEPLLDKHLPREKKDRRKIIFFLLIFLLLGGGAFIIWQINNGNKKQVAEIKSQKENTVLKSNDQPGTADKESAVSVNKENNKLREEGFTPIISNNSVDPLPGQEIEVDASGKIVSNNKKTNNQFPKKNNITKQPSDVLTKKTEPDNLKVDDYSRTEVNPVTIKDQQQKIKDNDVVKSTDGNKNNEQKIAEIKPEEQKQETKQVPLTAIEKTKTDKKKNKSSFSNNLFFTVSAGPDFSTVGTNTGTVKLTYGAGIGYQVTKKFSLRTGFYVARKVYTADPEDYHPPANFWNYYPNLKTIDANCKVYEIPVTIDYTFSNNKKQSWFASAGVSSLLMKKETYEYYFKPNYSPNYITYTKTYDNQNKHYFSVLDISGGYRRNINKNFSLRAEPYIKIAMRGIGFGKVNLNSGGVLISAVIKPFAKK